jgi:PhnB protein
MQARFSVGGFVLMASAAPPDRHGKPHGLSVSPSVDTSVTADRICEALKGEQRGPTAKAFWAKRFGSATNRFGVPRMISCEQWA